MICPITLILRVRIIMNTVEKTLFRLVDIDEIDEIHELTNMYDIMVEDDETFTLDCGIISHNSAIGALIKVRNPKTTGGYPLRGKPLNVRGMKPLDIVKNKEMFELMSILGLEIGKPAAELDLYEVVLDDKVYIVGKDDIIIHNGKEILVSTLI